MKEEETGHQAALSQPKTREAAERSERSERSEQRRLEKRLKDVQGQQKAILDSIPDIAWLKDKESRFIAVNEPFARACGFTPQELVGKTDLDIWPRELAELYRKDDQEVMQSGRRKCVEEPLADKEGKIQWIETIKTPIFNEKGEVIGTTGIARDITERKRIEERLSDSEERFRTLVQNVNIGVYRNTPDPGGRFLESNSAHYQMLGFDSLEEFLRTPVRQVYANPEDRKAFLEKIARDGFVKNEEVRLRKKDGTIFWASVTARAHFNGKGAIDWIDGVIDDITERKKFEEKLRESRHELEIKVKVRTAELTKANEDLRKYINERRQVEEKLRESESRYRAIVEDQTEFICRFLPGGVLTFVNDAYSRYFGRKKEELIGKSFMSFIPEEERPAVEKALASLSQARPVVGIEYRVIADDGRPRWQHWDNRALFDTDGRFIEFQAVGRDITLRKEAEQALEKSEMRYRTTLDAMNEAIHVVDTELRIVLANKIFKEWNRELGFTEEMVDRNVFEAFPFLPDKVREEYRRVFETGTILTTEEVNELKGKEIITETKKIPIFEGNKVARVVTVIDDVTIRKRLEYILRESEERYKRITEAITDYIFTVYIENGKPVKTIYGPTCLAVTGYSPAEFQADPYLWIKMVPEEDRKVVQEYTALILSGEKTLSFEHRLVKKDGTLRWVRNTSVAHLDNWGNLLSYDGLIQDITERKLIENRLARINECFLALGVNPLENINRLITLCGQLLSADSAMYNRFGQKEMVTLGEWNIPAGFLSPQEPQGHVCYDVYKKDDDDVTVIADLQATSYAQTDPNVQKYNLRGYIGYPVRVAGRTIGTLCALYKAPYAPSPEDKKVIGILASAIGVEEARREIRAELESRIKFEELITTISTEFIKVPPEEIDAKIQRALQMIGEFAGVDRSYIFLVYDKESRADNAYEWCAAGISSNIQELKGLDAKQYPWFAQRLRAREVIHIPRVGELPMEAQNEKKLLAGEQVQSIIILPMVYGQSLIGFIGFDAVREEKTWSAETISLLKTAGDIFTNALEHKYSDQALREGERFLSSIFNSIQDGISILDKELNIIQVNPTMERWYAHAMPLIGKKCYEAYHGRSEACKVCPSLRTLAGGEGARDIVPKTGVGGAITGWLELYTFPLVDAASGQLKGAIEYVRDISDRKRAENKLEILNRELLNSNKRLKQLALRDSHTGLYNHRYLEEAIEAEFYRARRYAHPISVLMLDIDYFKSINDVYGHQFGDLALKQMAGVIRKMVRRYDIIIRFGGEEFVIICPGADRATALVLGQRLLDTINAASFGNKEHSVRLKLSIAVAAYPEDKIAKGMDLVELADQILNKVKEFGGNKVYSSLDLKQQKAIPSEKKKESADARLLRDKLEKLSKRANQSLIEAVFAFAKTIEVKDHYTGEHVEKTVYYAVEIANALKLPRYEVELIKQAAMLHDLGKIGISEKVLLKTSKLQKHEYEEIKKHPQIGADILRPIQFFHNIIPLILYHHERWDGKGYPRGLKGEEIPIGARIIALADVYQALISDRPYRKKAFTKQEAIQIIRQGSGTQFDPKIVSLFLRILQKEK